MDERRMKELVAKGELRRRTIDRARASSLLRAAADSVAFAKSAPLTEQTATGVFTSIYDAFRQVGDAKWWLLGYEAYSHNASIELIKHANIPVHARLQQLTRIMELRNDASYRGYRIPLYEATAAMALWDEVHTALMHWAQEA